MQFGRKQIYTDVMQITKDNVVKVLRDALVIHEQNRSDIKFLLDYERGLQPIDNRIKEIRPEINIKVKDNMAAEITEFKLGYEWGSPIRYVQRANKGIRENNKDADNVGIAMLNEMMEEENKPSADQELARFIEICGIGYRLIKAKPDQYRFGSSVVDILTLNPMNTFIVYTNDVYRRPIMGVSYITDQNGNSTYGCYTEDTYFEVKNISKIKGESKRQKWVVSNGNGRKNIPAAIPIVEYINDYDRMGCFERVISEIDALNIVTSDRVNDIVQCVQSLLYDTATIRKVAVIAKGIGLGWGGDWKSIVDTPHFYLPKWGSTTSQLKAFYGTPDKFERTWKKTVKREKGALLWKASSKKTGSHCRIPKGAVVEVLYSKDWYTKVRYKNKVGYVNKKFVA